MLGFFLSLFMGQLKHSFPRHETLPFFFFKEKNVETEHSQLTDAIRVGVDGFFPLHVADHLGILQCC